MIDNLRSLWRRVKNFFIKERAKSISSIMPKQVKSECVTVSTPGSPEESLILQSSQINEASFFSVHEQNIFYFDFQKFPLVKSNWPSSNSHKKKKLKKLFKNLAQKTYRFFNNYQLQSDGELKHGKLIIPPESHQVNFNHFLNLLSIWVERAHKTQRVLLIQLANKMQNFNFILRGSNYMLKKYKKILLDLKNQDQFEEVLAELNEKKNKGINIEVTFVKESLNIQLREQLAFF